MKFRWDKKYLYWGVTALLVIIGAILFYYFLFHGSVLKGQLLSFLAILTPIIDGLVLAYLLWPIVRYLEKQFLNPCRRALVKKFKILENKEKELNRLIRGISILITLVIMFWAIAGLFKVVIPQITGSVQSIISQFPSYIENVTLWMERILAINPELEETVTDLFEEYSQDFISWIESGVLPKINEIVVTVSASMISVLKALWNLVIGLIISIYLLGNKEVFVSQGKKIVYAVWDKEKANSIIDDARMINRTFGGFISGKLLDSLIIGIICFICVTILKFPYPMLISVIVGITNVIPFFGPFIGAVPCALLILMVNPLQCLYFVLFIWILQQFDGNFLGPKILGESTGLSGFWVIFSITLFSGLMGVAGMILGVPTFAVFYALCKRRVNNSLEKKHLPVESQLYRNLDRIDEISGELVHNDEDEKYKEHLKNSALSKFFSKFRKKGEK